MQSEARHVQPRPWILFWGRDGSESIKPRGQTSELIANLVLNLRHLVWLGSGYLLKDNFLASATLTASSHLKSTHWDICPNGCSYKPRDSVACNANRIESVIRPQVSFHNVVLSSLYVRFSLSLTKPQSVLESKRCQRLHRPNLHPSEISGLVLYLS